MSTIVNNRIALFLPSLGGGGAERVMLTLAGLFSERGIQVDLVLSRSDGPYGSELPPRARVIDLKSSRIVSSLPKLVNYLRSERPCAMLSTPDHANIIALLARRLAGTPTRVIVRIANTVSVSAANDRQLRGRWIPTLIRRFYPWADGIVAVSKGVAEDVDGILGCGRAQIHVIYNPVVTPEMFSLSTAAVVHPFFCDEREPVILGVGRLVRQKGFDILIRAFDRVNAEQPCRLVILGEGERRGELQALIDNLNLSDRVDLPGFVDNPFAYMSQADVFVLSSEWEGLPNTLIQAMALGASVVSTDCRSGPREILDGGRLGALVPVGDPEAMAVAIRSCLRRREARTDIISARESYLAEVVAGEYLKLLRGEYAS